MWKHYYSVTSIAEALALLAEQQSHARIVAGGTDILIELERGVRKGIDTLIDISRVPGLDTISLHGDSIRLGALVTHNQVVNSALIQRRALPLAQAAWEVGAPQIRNRGTIAGNLITGSPANDTITPLWALNATVTLTCLQGERTLALPDFYEGVRRTAMRPDEMLTAIHIPALSESSDRGMFIKLGLRRAQAISVVNVAAMLGFAADNETVTRASIALGSVGPTIERVTTAEASLIGQPLTPAVIAEAGRLAAIALNPIDDIRSTAEYRAEMIRVLVIRALRTVAAHEERKSWPSLPPMLWGHLRGNTPVLDSSITHDAATPIETTINGAARTIETGQHKTLLRFLREDAGLPGTKEGCAEGECGACTVFLDGAAVMACMVPAPRAHHAEIVTVEGLASVPDNPTSSELHPVQRAFVDAGAVQCGYCTPGFLMSAAKLIEEYPQPTRAQVMQSITGNLCRCTGYYKIIEAVQNAAKESAASQAV